MSGVSRMSKRKECRYSRSDYSTYYLLIYQLAAAEVACSSNLQICLCFADDFKVHCSAFTMGLQIESENNTMVACTQTNESSGGSWTEMRPKQLPSLTDIFITAAPLRQLLMCISCDSSLSEMITVKHQQTLAVASEKMFN